jgi:hypothetical protein
MDQATQQGYTINIAAPQIPLLKIVANPNSLTIAQGQTGETTLTFTPSGGYTGTLALSCSGLPANSMCLFTQNGGSINSLTLSGNNQAESVVLTFETDVNSQQAGIKAAPSPLPPAAILPAFAIWFSSGLFGLAPFRRKRRMPRKDRRWLSLLLLLLFTGAAAFCLTDCGGSSSSGAHVTPVGTSTVTVTASPGSGTAQTLSIGITITQ